MRPGDPVGGELGGGAAGGGFCGKAAGARRPATIANPTTNSIPDLSPDLSFDPREKRIETFTEGTLVNQSLGSGSAAVKTPVRHFFVSNDHRAKPSPRKQLVTKKNAHAPEFYLVSCQIARGTNPLAEEDNFMTAALRFVDKTE